MTESKGPPDARELLIHAVAHELNNLLLQADLTTGLLSEWTIDKEQDRLLVALSKATRRGGWLVHSLQDIASAHSDDQVELDLPSLISAVVNTFEGRRRILFSSSNRCPRVNARPQSLVNAVYASIISVIEGAHKRTNVVGSHWLSINLFARREGGIPETVIEFGLAPRPDSWAQLDADGGEDPFAPLVAFARENGGTSSRTSPGRFELALPASLGAESSADADHSSQRRNMPNG